MQNFALRICVFVIFLGSASYSDAILTLLGVASDSPSRQFGQGILQTLAWISGAFVVISALEIFFWEGLVAPIVGRSVPSLLKNVLKAVVLVLAATGIVGIAFGRDITAIWATSSVISVVLGFALRGMIGDVFTGIALNIDGSIKTDDWIELHHRDFGSRKYGKVMDIGWRVSRIRLENNNVVLVPNGMMGSMAVTNFTSSEHRSRFSIDIVLDFEVPPERARRVLLAAARSAVNANGMLKDPAPSVLVSESHEHGINYKVVFWGRVNERSPASMFDNVLSHVLAHVRVAGLTPAVPKVDNFTAPRPRRMLEHDDLADRAEVLSRISLFSQSLEAGELEQLAHSIGTRTVEAGSALVRQGDAGNSMFVVAEGVLNVLINRPEPEEPLLVGHISAGQIFGEMSLLTGEPRSASVVASTSVVIYEIAHQNFETLLANRPGLSLQISELVAERRAKSAMAAQNASAKDIEEERLRLKDQILQKMRTVFAVLMSSAALKRTA